jgi:hypothetical protein
MHDSVFRRKQDFDLMDHVQRTRELRAEVQLARHALHEKMEALRREVAAVRGATERLQRDHGNGRNTKARSQAAGI